jgi:hypothetical protein
MNLNTFNMNQKNGIGFYPLIIMGVLLMLTNACQKDDDDLGNGEDDIVGIAVMITGTVNSAATGAAKVLAISSTDSYKMESITNNNFSIELDNGKPWGLIFLSSAEQPLGFVSLGNGIESLPLPFMMPGTDTIDLQTITRSGNIFTPSYNPIGNEIVMNNEQMEATASMDDYLATLLKNPDVNGNGQIDVLEGKFFKLEVIYFIKPGRFQGSDLTPTYGSSKLIEGYRLFVTIKDKSFPETVYFSGPAGSPLSNTPSEGVMGFNDHRVYNTPYLYNLMDTSSYIPIGGVYSIHIGGSTLTFNLPDQEYVKNNVLYPWPTLTLNGDGTMNKIDWVYQMPSGTSNINLYSLLREMQIQIEGTGNKCSSSNQLSDRLYDSPKLTPGTVSHIFSCQNIVWGSGSPSPNWQHVDRIMMTYEDHYDASYVVMYERNY